MQGDLTLKQFHVQITFSYMKQQDFTSRTTFSNDTTSFASSTESYSNHE